VSPPQGGQRDPYYGILAGPVDGPARLATVYPVLQAEPGLAVTHRSSGFTGKVVRTEAGGVQLRGPAGTERSFTLIPGAFSVQGRAVSLVPAPSAPAPGPGRTASGSISIGRERAKVARASRILVEGVHDAELVERVWGEDLRQEAVVVERLDGVDRLDAVISELRPGADRRLGVLVDHLVPGSKEDRLARSVRHPHVLVRGTPYVDVWEAVRPKTLGIPAWPKVPKGQDWKTGISAALGEAEPGRLWKRILSSVHSYADLEPALVGAVEELIDFVTGQG
jgi:hypothetical protein